MREITPEKYGLPKRTVLTELAEGHLALVIDRKSRIIMKDGEKILAKVHQIKCVDSGMKVSLQTSAPVCSKTITYLAEEDVEVLPL